MFREHWEYVLPELPGATTVSRVLSLRNLNPRISSADDGRPEARPEAETANDDRRGRRRLRFFAAALGLAGTLLALAIPLLPVRYDVAELRWPTAQGTGAVSAPLTGYQPISVNARVPCTAMHDLAARSTGPAVIFATTPPSSTYGSASGMSLTLHGDQFVVVDNGQQLAAEQIPAGNCTVDISSNGTATTVTTGGHTLANVQNDVRPEVTGIYSGLDAHKDNVHGLSLGIRTDTRYETTATALKIAAMVLAGLAFLGSLALLRRIDLRSSGRRVRLAPRAWWKPTGRDVAVLGVLVIWWLIGGMTSDDGFILTMARAQADTGYVGNYYRWFNTPEAPFGWFYEGYALWVRVSTATPWVRLPALVMGAASWLLISREVLPRLGREVRRSRAAGWAAGAVFLCFWLPYDNGLRPEPVVVLWTLLATCAVERTVATRRLLPAALGLFAAAFAVAATPTGLIAVAPFLAAAVPLLRLLRDRAREYGWLAVLAPLLSAGTIVLTVVFENQTLRSVVQGTTIRTALGPAESWYQEFDRYQALFSTSADGSLERRFPVLLLFLCIVTCAVVLVRRHRITGAALGPSRRLVVSAILSLGILALTPTKWTHHFGAFAAIGSSLAALTALASSASVLRSKRNRSLFTGGLLVVAALSLTGPNAWWYVSNWGQPWYDKAPSFHGHMLSTLVLLCAVVAFVIAAVEHFQLISPSQFLATLARPRNRRRMLRLASMPLTVVCATLVIAELATTGKAILKEADSYSLGKDNVAQLTGHSCGLSDYVQVEPNPAKDVLPIAQQAQGAGRQPVLTGLRTDGYPQDDPSWQPPYGLGNDSTPIWGNYGPSGPSTAGHLRTPWYTLPDAARTGASPLVVDIAGDDAGDNSIVAQFGKQTASGFTVIDSQQVTNETDAPNWREARLLLSGTDAQASEVRLVVTTNELGYGNWMALTAPRVPVLESMTNFIGKQPTFMEWPTALVHPCLQPFDSRDGIAQMPKYRVAASSDFAATGELWSAPDGGGPFGWLSVAATERTLPTYLKGDLNRDWGTLYEIDPYTPAAPASTALQVSHETHSGLYSPGPTSNTIELPGVPQETGGLLTTNNR